MSTGYEHYDYEEIITDELIGKLLSDVANHFSFKPGEFTKIKKRITDIDRATTQFLAHMKALDYDCENN